MPKPARTGWRNGGIGLHRDGREWQRRITALHLTITHEPAVPWTMALLPGQDPASLD